MGKNSKIEWCDHTFNPAVGCTKVSAACDNCYAESWAKQSGQPQLWQGERRRTSEANWRQPLKWNLEAKAAGERRRVFCASLADVFDNQWLDEWRADLWRLIASTPNLDWLILTKRPQNIAKMLPPSWGEGWPNVWLGSTIESQEEADRRMPRLLAVPAAVRFLSCEPLLSEINVSSWIGVDPGIHLVIAGGESGGKARPSHPNWFRSLRDQCATEGVGFHFKQWGNWAPSESIEPGGGLPSHGATYIDGVWHFEIIRPTFELHCDDEPDVWRTTKKRAGRSLDGVTHDGYPRQPSSEDDA